MATYDVRSVWFIVGCDQMTKDDKPMWRAQLNMAVRGIRVGILTLAVSLQMLPIFFLLLVFAYGLGFTGLGMLVMVPLFLLVTFVIACWLTARQASRGTPRTSISQPSDRPSIPKPRPRRPIKEGLVLIKTREERYRDLAQAFKTDGR